MITNSEFEGELKRKLPDRFGHTFVTCSRQTEVEESTEEESGVEEGAPLEDKKFEVPKTKRPLNYFNKEFEEMNKKRKEALYSAATPYSTRGIGGRARKFEFPK